MKTREFLAPKNIPTYNRDKRLSIQSLLDTYQQLESEYHWVSELVYLQKAYIPDIGQVELPILCLRTPQTGPAVWCLFGIHGEEPAGPNAFAENIKFLGELSKEIPMIAFPLCNPLGYARDWRYANEYRDPKKGFSVGDSDHLLLDLSGKTPRQPKPSSPAAEALSLKVLSLIKWYPPILSIDHHEDEDLKTKNRHPLSYIYSQGIWGAEDHVAHEVVKALRSAGMPIIKNGQTSFGEKIHNGVVVSNDGSIDELLAARNIFQDGRVVTKPAALSAITVETPTIKVLLKKRIAVHGKIIQSYRKLRELALQQEKDSRQNDNSFS